MKILKYVIFIFGLVAHYNNALAASIYVDNTIPTAICSNYNVESRTCGAGSLKCYKSITPAVNSSIPGDVVYVRSGVYYEKVAITNSGNENARITIQNHPNEAPMIDGTGVILGNWGALVKIGANYVTLDGFVIQNANGSGGRGIATGDNHHWEIKNCTVRNITGDGGIWVENLDNPVPAYGKIQNCTVYNNQARGICVWKHLGGYVLIDRCTVYNNNGSGNYDGVEIGGGDGGTHHVIVRNCTIHDNTGAQGTDQLDVGGHSAYWPHHILVEKNDIYRGPNGMGAVKFHVHDGYGIFRQNRITDLYMEFYSPPDPVKIYHNTFHKNNNVNYYQLYFWVDSAKSGIDYQDLEFKNNSFTFNQNSHTILADGPGELNTTHIYFQGNYFRFGVPGKGITWDHSGGTRNGEQYPCGTTLTKFDKWQSDFTTTAKSNHGDITTPISAIFVNASERNYNLVAKSPIIDKGTNLTTIKSATVSGTEFTVEDARYFMDGWGLIDGDTIQVGGAICRISNVDYSTNKITVTQPISWSTGAPVNLVYYGSAPDPGAYEYTISSPQGVRIVK